MCIYASVKHMTRHTLFTLLNVNHLEKKCNCKKTSIVVCEYLIVLENYFFAHPIFIWLPPVYKIGYSS